MISFNNKFFDTKEAALEFKKRNGRGKLLHYNPNGRETRNAYIAEMIVASQRRGEVVNPEEMPYCVAWNEIDKEG